MNHRTPALLSAAVVALVAACSSTSVTTTDHATPASGFADSAPPVGPEGSLQKGTPAETVRRIMGPPAQVEPMSSPAGKAEVWIYRRTTPGGVRQIQVGARSIPIQTSIDANGMIRVVQSIEEPIFQQEYEYFDETVRLLMFKDQFVEQTRSFKRRVKYQ